MRPRRHVAPATRAALLLGSLFLVVVALPGTARACSCARLEPRDAIASYEAAFVGTLIDRHEGGPPLPGWEGIQVDTFRFTVEHDVKGNLGAEVEVISSSDGASCGLEGIEGRSTGLFLTLTDDGVWTSGLCEQVEPEALLEAAAPLPAPDGQGPIRLLVGGNFGEARVMSLDARGRTLAYGYGEGDVYDLAVCPGGRRSVESVADGRRGFLVVRDVATLRVVREVPLVESRFPSIYVVACLDEEGEHLLAIDEKHPETRVHEVRGDQASIVFATRGNSWGEIVDDVPYLVVEGTRFGRVDVASGRFEEIVRLPAHTSGARLSPDGRWVAAVRYGDSLPGDPPSDIVVVSVEDGSFTSTPLVGWNDGGRVQWLADDRLLFLAMGEEIDRLSVYDIPSMDEIVGADGWYGHEGVVAGDVVYGLDGRLVSVELGVDRTTRVERVFAGDAFALTLVPGAVEAEPLPPPSRTTPSPVTGPIPSARKGGSIGIGWAVVLGIGIGLAITALRRWRAG